MTLCAVTAVALACRSTLPLRRWGLKSVGPLLSPRVLWFPSIMNTSRLTRWSLRIGKGSNKLCLCVCVSVCASADWTPAPRPRSAIDLSDRSRRRRCSCWWRPPTESRALSDSSSRFDSLSPCYWEVSSGRASVVEQNGGMAFVAELWPILRPSPSIHCGDGVCALAFLPQTNDRKVQAQREKRKDELTLKSVDPLPTVRDHVALVLPRRSVSHRLLVAPTMCG